MADTSIIDDRTSSLLSWLQDVYSYLTLHPHTLFLTIAAVGLFAFSRRVPVLRTLVSAAAWLATGWLLWLLAQQQGLINPGFSTMMGRFGLDEQQVTGREVRIKQSADGHFWARVNLNGVERRMLVDSGATVTALSARTAEAAGVEPRKTALPLLIRTANGTVAAKSATVDELSFGPIRAHKLSVVVSPGLGDFDVLGMNFLSRLKGWRVEDNVLILTPKRPVKGTVPAA